MTTPKTVVNYEREIETLVNSIIRMSHLAASMTSAKEQQQMDGKKASFFIKGLEKRYTFLVTGNKIERTTNLDNVTTYCVVSSPEVFLRTVDKIFDGDIDAFQRGLQRGELVMRGHQSLHDILEWKDGLKRLYKMRKIYGMA